MRGERQSGLARLGHRRRCWVGVAKRGELLEFRVPAKLEVEPATSFVGKVECENFGCRLRLVIGFLVLAREVSRRGKKVLKAGLQCRVHRDEACRICGGKDFPAYLKGCCIKGGGIGAGAKGGRPHDEERDCGEWADNLPFVHTDRAQFNIRLWLCGGKVS